MDQMRDRAIEDWVAKLAKHMADRGALDFGLRTVGLVATAREYAAVVEPDIRADERRRVREELLAIAQDFAATSGNRSLGLSMRSIIQDIADRIAPEEEDQCTR